MAPEADEVVVVEDFLTGAGAEFVRVRVCTGRGDVVSMLEERLVELAPDKIVPVLSVMIWLSAKYTGVRYG
jgi:hypothetical protein